MIENPYKFQSPRGTVNHFVSLSICHNSIMDASADTLTGERISSAVLGRSIYRIRMVDTFALKIFCSILGRKPSMDSTTTAYICDNKIQKKLITETVFHLLHKQVYMLSSWIEIRCACNCSIGMARLWFKELNYDFLLELTRTFHVD